MPYDKYHNWPLPSLEGNIFPVIQGTGIENQVLRDLADTGDEIDRLEILDSYAAYSQRAYQQEQARYLANQIAQALGILLEPTILSRFLKVDIVHRARPVKTKK